MLCDVITWFASRSRDVFSKKTLVRHVPVLIADAKPSCNRTLNQNKTQVVFSNDGKVSGD